MTRDRLVDSAWQRRQYRPPDLLGEPQREQVFDGVFMWNVMLEHRSLQPSLNYGHTLKRE